MIDGHHGARCWVELVGWRVVSLAIGDLRLRAHTGSLLYDRYSSTTVCKKLFFSGSSWTGPCPQVEKSTPLGSQWFHRVIQTCLARSSELHRSPLHSDGNNNIFQPAKGERSFRLVQNRDEGREEKGHILFH